MLTALLIAGGSDGVFRIFSRLGIRNPRERKEKAEEVRNPLPQGASESPQGGDAEETGRIS